MCFEGYMHAGGGMTGEVEPTRLMDTRGPGGGMAEGDRGEIAGRCGMRCRGGTALKDRGTRGGRARSLRDLALRATCAPAGG